MLKEITSYFACPMVCATHFYTNLKKMELLEDEP